MAQSQKPLGGKYKINLFAGIPVKNYKAALDWYERLLGCPPTYAPKNSTEAVWDLADHLAVFIELSPEHAGHARHSIFVDDLDDLVAQIAERGLKPIKQETYSNGVRKANYKDPDKMR